MKSKINLLITVLVLASVSCLENDIEYNTKNLDYRIWDIAAPIANIHVPFYHSLKKKLDNTYIDDDGIICLRYTHSEKIEWNDEIALDDYSTPGVIAWDNLAGTVSPLKQSLTVKLTIADDESSYVNEAELTSGIVEFLFRGSGTSGFTGTITITIPGLTNNEGFFEKVIDFPSSGASFSLEGFKLKTDNDHRLTVDVTIDASGAGSLSVDLSITEMEVSYLSGYFGKTTYTPQEKEVKFDFFDKMNFEGIFGFQKIEMTAEVTNWTGIPINISSDVCFVNGNGSNQPLELENKIDFDVPAATESGNNHTVTPSENSFFTSSLSEIEFESRNYPIGFKFINLKGEANPHGISPNFIVKNDQGGLADVDFTLALPLIVRIDNYSRSDTVAFDYNDIIKNDEEFSNSIEDMTVKLSIVNALPFDVILEAIAIDADDNRVETILAETPIVADEGTQYIPIRLVQSQLKEFMSENVKNIVLHTTSKTEGYVPLKENSFIDITVSVQFISSSSIIFE